MSFLKKLFGVKESQKIDKTENKLTQNQPIGTKVINSPQPMFPVPETPYSKLDPFEAGDLQDKWTKEAREGISLGNDVDMIVKELLQFAPNYYGSERVLEIARILWRIGGGRLMVQVACRIRAANASPSVLDSAWESIGDEKDYWGVSYENTSRSYSMDPPTTNDLERQSDQPPIVFTSGTVPSQSESAKPSPSLADARSVAAPEQSISFLEAAENGDIAKVRALLKDNPNLVFSKNLKGSTPVHQAAWKGHGNIVKLLLANNADVNVTDPSGITPLHAAAVHGHLRVVEILLAGKAEINAKKSNANGTTPLHFAALHGHKKVVELLLANKAEVNGIDINGMTPLRIAAYMGSPGHMEIFELLRKHGGH
jgi:ankyrin repeat protein